ncbi:MAG: TlpA family protein disulfide reductase [Tissierellia bacterium]|nr:TlpA family protein disulfide reductase [Tissierellia bacterium]
MKKILILIISIALIIAGCANGNVSDPGIQETENTEAETEPQTEETNVVIAPDFELESLDGSRVKLSQMRDKNVILNFWYTGCVFCVMEMPDLQKLQEAYIDDLTVLTINSGESKEKIQNFMEDENLNLNVLLDEDLKVTNNYGVRSFPATIAINKKGEVIGGYVGMLSYDQMEQIYGFFE